MVVIDSGSRILSFGAAAERLFGYVEVEMVVYNVVILTLILMPSPDRERRDAYMARYLATGECRIIGIGPWFVEDLFGGVSRTMLTHGPLPVFMAH